MINPEFAHSVGLRERLAFLDRQGNRQVLPSFQQERCESMTQPFLAAAVERYDRVAASVGIEARDPFLDLRVVRYSLSLPPDQKLGGGGWPKVVLRRAMQGRLPDEVRWRRGKQHLGWAFTSSMMGLCKHRLPIDLERNRSTISQYVNIHAVNSACEAYCRTGRSPDMEGLYAVVHLAVWLDRHSRRPLPPVVDSNRRG